MATNLKKMNKILLLAASSITKLRLSFTDEDETKTK